MGLLWFVDKNEELFCYILSLYLQVKVVDLMRIQSTCRSLRSLLNSDVASFLWKYQVDMCLVCYEREHNAMRYFVSQGVSYEAYWKGAACRVETKLYFDFAITHKLPFPLSLSK